MTSEINQAAHVIVRGVAQGRPSAWPTHADGLEELEDLLKPENIVLIARLDNQVVGWIGGIPEYYDFVPN